MKKLGLLAVIIAMLLTSSFLFSSCQKQNADNVSSDIISEEITSSDASTSEPEKEAESSKAENSSKPETSSKPKESSKPTSSKNNTSSNFLSNITITPTFPRPQKEQSVSSKPEVDMDELDSYFSTDSIPETELDKHKKLIIGTWNFTYDLTPILVASGYKVNEPIILEHYYTFNNDRSYFVTVSDKQAYYDKVGPYVIPKIETQLKNELSREHITEAEFKLVMGITVSDYAKIIFRNQVNTPLYRSGGYFFSDGKLCLGDTDSGTLDQCLYAFIDDDTLVITYDEGSITVRRHKEENTVTSEG